MKKVLVSRCLYGGDPVRYDEADVSVEDPRFNKWRDEGRLVPICAEVFGGCPIPRPGSRRVGDRIIEVNGNDATEEYMKGAKEALRLAKEHNVICCIMKEFSPSCGSKVIHDEKREKTIPGQGLVVELLREAGFKVFSEYDLPEAEKFINEHDPE